MILTIWRVFRNQNIRSTLTGEGARLYGGRWSSPGRSVIYGAQYLSLAVLEVLVHADNRKVLGAYSKMALRIATELIEHISVEELPVNWTAAFPGAELQAIGDDWLTSRRSLVLSLPSVIIPEEKNYLINPEHPDFKSLIAAAAEPLSVDSRLSGIE